MTALDGMVVLRTLRQSDPADLQRLSRQDVRTLRSIIEQIGDDVHPEVSDRMTQGLYDALVSVVDVFLPAAAKKYTESGQRETLGSMSQGIASANTLIRTPFLSAQSEKKYNEACSNISSLFDSKDFADIQQLCIREVQGGLSAAKSSLQSLQSLRATVMGLSIDDPQVAEMDRALSRLIPQMEMRVKALTKFQKELEDGDSISGTTFSDYAEAIGLGVAIGGAIGSGVGAVMGIGTGALLTSNVAAMGVMGAATGGTMSGALGRPELHARERGEERQHPDRIHTEALPVTQPRRLHEATALGDRPTILFGDTLSYVSAEQRKEVTRGIAEMLAKHLESGEKTNGFFDFIGIDDTFPMELDNDNRLDIRNLGAEGYEIVISKRDKKTGKREDVAHHTAAVHRVAGQTDTWHITSDAQASVFTTLKFDRDE